MSEKPLYYKGYTGNINYSSEDKCYYGQLQNINGLVDYCGEMLEELKTDIKVAVDDYIILKEAHQLQ